MIPTRLPNAESLSKVTLERRQRLKTDVLAVEAPLQLSVNGRRFAVLMRTPSTQNDSDLDLCVGFLFSEGIIEGIDDLASMGYCSDPNNLNARHAVVTHLHSGSTVLRALDTRERSTAVNSACGLCGRMDIDMLSPPFPARESFLKPDESLVRRLPDKLRAHQSLFAQTGGLHGAALFDSEGVYLTSAEDVGRHNAVDKVVGNRLRHDGESLRGGLLVVSSRLSFELVQKAIMAGVSSLVGVGAASDLAHATAVDCGLHLFSFTNADGTNYHGVGREQTT